MGLEIAPLAARPTPPTRPIAGNAGCTGSLVAGMALNNVGRRSPRRIEAEQRGEIIDRAPTGGGDGVYDDYFAEFDDSHSRRDDRWGG